MQLVMKNQLAKAELGSEISKFKSRRVKTEEKSSFFFLFCGVLGFALRDFYSPACVSQRQASERDGQKLVAFCVRGAAH